MSRERDDIDIIDIDFAGAARLRGIGTIRLDLPRLDGGYVTSSKLWVPPPPSYPITGYLGEAKWRAK